MRLAERLANSSMALSFSPATHAPTSKITHHARFAVMVATRHASYHGKINSAMLGGLRAVARGVSKAD